MMRLTMALLVLLVGCTPPCFYRGKSISHQDAEYMRSLGMNVECGSEQERVNEL